MFSIQSRQEGSASVLTVQGSLVFETIPELRTTVQEVLAKCNAKVLVVNLEGVGLIDSSGIGLLVACHHTMKSKQGELRLCGPSPQVREALDKMNLSALFSIFPEELDALREALP
jgi:anti-sigma B factor antagonist